MIRKSVWEERKEANRIKLNRDITSQIVVIGAGMAGVLSALLLQEAGWNVVVIEALKAGRGITKNTTAKITIQHHLIYDKLIRKFGIEKAREYAGKNQEALKKYEELAGRYKIPCSMEKQPAFVYSLGEVRKLEAETLAAQQLGINALFTKEVDLPFEVRGAVKFEDQLQFQPLEFLDILSEKLIIYEQSKAVEVTKKNRVLVEGEGGKIYEVKADYVIVATHYPFINIPGYYFLRMYQERSYVISLESEETLSYGMYIDEDKKGFSFRRYKNMVLLGGGSHRTGENPGDSYEKLLTAAGKWYPGCPVGYQWSNQDCMPLDGVPYIGAYSRKTPGLYVATGFGKWGMSTAMTAALLLRDAIGSNSTDTGIFSPARIKPVLSAKNLSKNIITATKRWSLQLLYLPRQLTEGMVNGQGTIVRYHGKKIGIYQDETGKTYAVDIKCPHLGCMLAWNSEEKTWDCPCHGSRFDYKGNLIENPSLTGNSMTCTRPS